LADPAARRPASNLPARRTPLIGRGDDLRSLLDLTLGGGGRLVTLTGVGGVGKTSLALETARSAAERMPDGAWLIDLGAVGHDADVAATACAALGLLEQARGPAAVLVEFLEPRRALLCIDNCEHLAGAVAALVDELLDGCANVRILATSRTPLHVRGESVFQVSPVQGPADGPTRAADLAGIPAAELFVRRAQAASADFALTEDNADAVAEICRRLAGIPLAIELAASQVATLTPAEIAGRLAGERGLPGAGRSGSPARQRTMKATLDWSLRLLDPTQRALFRRLSVFAGGWTLEGAERVCGDGSGPAGVGPALRALVEHSLVLHETRGSASRFRFLVPVADYAAARLAASDEADDVARAHAGWALALAAQRAPGHGHVGPGDLDRIALEHANCIAALQWAERTRSVPVALGFIGALLEYWRVRGLLRSGIHWMEMALDLLPDEQDPRRARVQIGIADCAQQLGEHDLARRCLDAAIPTCEASADRRGLRTALAVMGDIAASRAEYTEARDAYRRAREFLDETVDADVLGFWYANMGRIALREGSLAEAEALLGEARRALAASEPCWYLGYVLAQLGGVALRQGDLTRAGTLLREALGELGRFGAQVEAIGCLEDAARLALARRDATRAATLIAAASALREATGAAASAADRQELAGALEEIRRLMPAAAFDAAWALGRSLSFESAIGLATSRQDPRRDVRVTPLATALTPREQEVAALVAAGLSNAGIAERLGIAPGTARIHVEHILGKLGLTSRVQIATRVVREVGATGASDGEAPATTSMATTSMATTSTATTAERRQDG
jgi:non-specific serine/threonine protein kinase